MGDLADVQRVFDDLAECVVVVDAEYRRAGYSTVSGKELAGVSPHNLCCLKCTHTHKNMGMSFKEFHSRTKMANMYGQVDEQPVINKYLYPSTVFIFQWISMKLGPHVHMILYES